jgi:hypothetical protein
MTVPLRLGLTVAPRFQLAPDWTTRLTVGSGVAEDDGRFFARGPWRPLTPDEMTPLGSTAASVCLFQTPAHLRTAWWDLLDKAAASGGGPLPGFDAFSGQVADFLRFKRMAVPSRLEMEAVVTAAGRCSMRSDHATGAPAGLGPSLAPWATFGPPEGALPRLWAVVNLGDEESSLVLIAVPIPELPTYLTLRQADQPPPTTVGDVVERFLHAYPDWPPIRMRLGTGEGFGLPAAGLILDADATDKQEPDVLLLISEQPPD